MSDRRQFRQPRFQRPPGACEMLIVRHGESAPAMEGEEFPLVDGHGDPPLDPVGEAQAERAAERLAREGITAIYATTLQRTRQTAAPLAARLGLEVRIEADLREVFLGEWEGGVFRKHVAEQHPIAQEMFARRRWDVIPGAEPAADFAARVRASIERIAAAHPDTIVALFVHGGVIGEIVGQAVDGNSFALGGNDNAGISHVVVTPQRWIVRRFNDTGHLAESFTQGPDPLT
ncbi:MAG: histidine phosphatase family protein [Acidimicrobiales bacterium]